MKRISALLLALLLMLGCACAEEAPAAAATLTAVGEAALEPDAQTIVLSFALRTEAQTAPEASTAMDALREALQGLLGEHGVAEVDVRITRYDMAHVYEYRNGKLETGKLLKGFKLETGLETRLSDDGQTRDIVEALCVSTLDVDYQLSFEAAFSQQTRDDALALAAQEAARHAQLMAQSMGLVLGDLVCLEESTADGLMRVEATYTVK